MHLVAVNAGADVSGAERVLVDLLRRAHADGARVTLVCPEGPLPELLGDRVEHVTVPLARLGGARGLRRVREIAGLPLSWFRSARILRRAAAGADALVSNSTFALPAVGLAYPLARRCRRRSRNVPGTITWLVHDTVTTTKQRSVLRLGAHALTKAVAVSAVTAASVAALVPRVEVRPNGVEVPERMSGGTAAVAGQPTVGILAVLTEWKGHEILLESIAGLPEVRLEIAGAPFPGSEEFAARLRERASRPDLAGRVRFLGQVDKRDVFPRWHALISASTSPEAGPLGVLEGMAHGVPLIATDHGGSAEYLSDGAGLLVPPGDAPALAAALRRLLADPDLSARLRERARQRASTDHDRTDTVPRMLAALCDG